MNTTHNANISDRAFHAIRGLFHQESGIHLSEAKRALVASRLRKRLMARELADFDAYHQLLQRNEEAEERRLLVDLLTTNETYFFREPQHFDHLARTLATELAGKSPRIWCAAASSGEEPYSLAMTLDDTLGNKHWEVIGTDLCRKALQRAKRGLYNNDRLQHMPSAYLKRYCLRGTGDYDGMLLIQKSLREKVSFDEHNLLHSPTALGKFDIIFMRNVLIYFEPEMKRQVVHRALDALKPGGLLYIGRSETLHGLNLPVKAVEPSVYRKE